MDGPNVRCSMCHVHLHKIIALSITNGMCYNYLNKISGNPLRQINYLSCNPKQAHCKLHMEAAEEYIRESYSNIKDKEMDVQDSPKREVQCEIRMSKLNVDSAAEDSPSDVNSSTLDIETSENKLRDSTEEKTIAKDLQESKQSTDLNVQNNLLSDETNSFIEIELGTLKNKDKEFDLDNFREQQGIAKKVQDCEQNAVIVKDDSPSDVISCNIIDIEILGDTLQGEQCNSNNSLGQKEVVKEVQESEQNMKTIVKEDPTPDVTSCSLIDTEILRNTLQDEQCYSNNVPGKEEIEKDVQESKKNIDANAKNDPSSDVSSFSLIDIETLGNNLQNKYCTSNDKPFLEKEQTAKDVQESTQNMNTTTKDGSTLIASSFSTINIKMSENNLQNKQIESDGKLSVINAEDVKICKQTSLDEINNLLSLNLLKQYNSEDSESEAVDCCNNETPSKTSSLVKGASLTNANMYRVEVSSETDEGNSDVESVREQKEVNFYNKDDFEDDDDEGLMADDENVTKKKPKPPRVHGELLLEDLPPIQDLHITVPEQECVKFGQVHSIVEQLVLVNTLPTSPLLNLDTVLFLDKGQRVLGEIFDVCGPVSEPLYCVRFNSNDQIHSKKIIVGDIVYVAPKTEHTQYIILSNLMKMRGSDASWEHDIEPPPRYLDYSDDEEERRARQKMQKNKRIAESNNKSDSSDDDSISIQQVAPPVKKGLRNQRNKRNPHANQSITGDSNCSHLTRPRWCHPSSIRHPYKNSWHSNYSQCYTSGQFPKNYRLPGYGAYSQFCTTAAIPPQPSMIHPTHVSHAVTPPPLYSQTLELQLLHQPPPRHQPPPKFVRNPFSGPYNS